jgi:hypothetical protein
MAKLTAHYQKKHADQNYGSEMVGASVEVEVEGNDPESVKAGLRRLFSLAKESVAEQLTAAVPPARTQPTNRVGQASTPAHSGGNGNGGSPRVPATAAQKKAIFAISKSLGLDPAQHNAEQLSVREASALIDELKNQQAGSR